MSEDGSNGDERTDPTSNPAARADLDRSDVFEASSSYVEQHGFLSWIGLDVREVEEGRVVMELPYDEKLANLDEHGTIHGGIVATLIDTASGHVLRTTFEDPFAVRMATADLNVAYVRPARDDLVATAEVVRSGASMGVTDVEVESTAPDGTRKVVAVGRTTYRLFRE